MMFENFNLDPETKKQIVQRLWPTMLFLVVMSITTGSFAYFWTSSFKNQIHSIIGFYAWFAACILALIYGCLMFYKDGEIQTAKSNIQA